MPNITKFDPEQRYIILPIFVSDRDGEKHLIKVLLDTGAPITEFSDEALQFLCFLDKTLEDVKLKPGLQTQKYSKLKLPHTEICGHVIEDLEVYVSHFERSWGIKALVGLDFFRTFRVTIDYSKGHIVSEAY
jgi:hypothetical protein